MGALNHIFLPLHYYIILKTIFGKLLQSRLVTKVCYPFYASHPPSLLGILTMQPFPRPSLNSLSPEQLACK